MFDYDEDFNENFNNFIFRRQAKRIVGRDIELLIAKCSPDIRNHGLPGLESYILVNKPGYKVRILSKTMTHYESVVPQSNGFDSTSVILRGSVKNTLWQPVKKRTDTTITCGVFNIRHKAMHIDPYEFLGKAEFQQITSTYTTGCSYNSKSSDIQSFEFSIGTVVIQLEYNQIEIPKVSLPFAGGSMCNAIQINDWMFK